MSRLISAVILSIIIITLTAPNVNAGSDNNRTLRKTYELGKKYKNGINSSNRDDFIQDLTGKSRKNLTKKARREMRKFTDDMGVEVSESDRTKGQYTVKKKKRKGGQTSRYYTGKNAARGMRSGGRGMTGDFASNGVNN